MHLGKKAWRESASLIILAKNSCKVPQSPNYKVLVLKRPETMHFMPNAIVFPGGAADPADESQDWLQHFKNCGVTDQKLAEVTNVQGPRPDIFETLGISALKREISLRITAIREAFEELGVLICRKKNEINDTSEYGNFVEEFNRKEWQDKIVSDPGNFINLCKEHELVPDIWRLYEWSAWLTPALIRTRFETAFFLVSVLEEPKLLPHGTEVGDARWETPASILKSFHNEKLDLAPPQFYELSRIGKYSSIEALTQFARLRNNRGNTLQYPVIYKCAEGLLIAFPGDHLYPANLDLNQVDYDMNKYENRTFDELRQISNKMHRCEQRSLHNTQFVLNFQLPDGHVGPMAKL